MTDTAEDTSTDTFYRDQGRLLRAARVGCGLLIREAAEGSGLSMSTLSAYERGERKPPMPRLRKLAQLYGIHVANFIPEEAAD